MDIIHHELLWHYLDYLLLPFFPFNFLTLNYIRGTESWTPEFFPIVF